MVVCRYSGGCDVTIGRVLPRRARSAAFARGEYVFLRMIRLNVYRYIGSDGSQRLQSLCAADAGDFEPLLASWAFEISTCNGRFLGRLPTGQIA